MIREANIDDYDDIKNIARLISNDYIIPKSVVSKIYVYEHADEIQGFISINNLVNEVEIIDIAVLKKYQNNSVGSKLIDFIISNINVDIFLEVNVNNKAAIKLYEKYNFKIINTREKYYKDEDAYIMKRNKI